MKKEIKEFYDSKDFQLSKLISKRPKNVSATGVVAAAESLYEEIQQGLKIKDVQIPRRIWLMAKGGEGDEEFLAEIKEIKEQHLAEIKEIKEQYFIYKLRVGIGTVIMAIGIFMRWLSC